MTDSATLMGNDNERTGPDGMPQLDRAEKDAAYNGALKMLVGFPIVGSLVGFGLAYAICAYSADAAALDGKIAALAKAGGHWSFLSGYVFHRAVGWLNMYPMVYKAQVMRAKSGNLRANMLVYELVGQGAPQNKVVLAEGGELGRYNRANRSLHHFVEGSLPVVLSILLASAVLPAQVFALTCTFCLGRIGHQIGYSSVKGYGAHALGFLAAMLSSEALGGLLLLVGLKGCGVL